MESDQENIAKSGSLLSFTTFSPVDIPFSLIRGFNRKSPTFASLLRALNERSDIKVGTLAQDEQEYVSLDSDVSSLSLFIWRTIIDEVVIRYHVYPNELAIVECDFSIAGDAGEQYDAKSLEKSVQKIASQSIALSVEVFKTLLEDIYLTISNPLLLAPRSTSVRTYWTARALTIECAKLSDPHTQNLLHDWLAETERPQDAELICNLTDSPYSKETHYRTQTLPANVKTESMTWLNYVIVDKKGADDPRSSTMILAQYCYAAQEKCNIKLQETIAQAYIDGNLLDAKSKLEDSRIQSKLHQVSINEHKKYLTRQKRKYLDEIFESWEFQLLIDNGNQMEGICSNKIEEANSKQSKLSSIKTDRILFAISLFAIFEFLIFLSQHSREVMSRPALDYNDDSSSWILTFIASLDADIMFGIGFALIFILGIVYTAVVKRKL